MMRLIIGLGNPETEYKNTRHNAGHLVIEKLQKQLLPNTKVEKTSVSMNNSGDYVLRLKNFYKVELNNLYIVYDDLDLPLGSFKISKGKSPRVHNGIKSVIKKVGSEDFWHVRIGIDSRAGSRELNGRDYVLQNFSDYENKQLEKIIVEVVKLLCNEKQQTK